MPRAVAPRPSRPQSAHLTERSPQFTPESVARLREQWGRLWDTRRKILVEKSPPDLIRMRFLAAAFPPAWFVIILRHPLSVCRRVEWRMRLLCVTNWLNAYEWAFEDVKDGELKAYVTFYEHWSTHPLAEMRAMTPVLGLERRAASASGGCTCPHARLTRLRLRGARRPDFNWSSVLTEGAQANLNSHANTGYARCLPPCVHVIAALRF